MSIKVMSAIWERAPQKGAELLVLLALADWANDRGECDPSYNQLAEKARVDRRRAIRLVSKLIKDKAITVAEGQGFRFGKQGASNLIKVVTPPPPSGAETTGGSGLCTTGGGGAGTTSGSGTGATHNGQQQLPTTTVNTTKDLPSLRSGATGHNTTTAAALPPKRKVTRNPKPLFDAFKAAFPTAKASKAGEFDSECSKVGLSIEDWHAFMASTKAKQDYLDGYLTMGNALNRFNAWAVAVGRRSNPASRDDTPDGAPANWRDIVYTHDGTRRYPALALPRLGLEPYAPPSEWPTWYQQFEGVQS